MRSFAIISNVTCQSTMHSPPQWRIPIVISKTFSWIDDTDLCNWARICSWGRFHFNISHQTICSSENSKNSAYVPFFCKRVLICDDNEIIDFYISAFWVFHFFRGMSWGRASRYHLFQKASTIFWQNSNRWRECSVWRNGPWGTLLVALPSMMSFEHK